MVTQVIKRISLSYLCTLFCIITLGQSASTGSPLIIECDISKGNYFRGDTLCFTIRNKTKIDRGYTIEVISVDSISTFNSFYTAYFNKDTSFFVKLNRNMRMAKRKRIGYLIPEIKAIPHEIKAGGLSKFIFVLKGKKLKGGSRIKFRIVPDILNDEPEYKIETQEFWIFVSPL